MNYSNLDQILQHYTDRFEELNNDVNQEYYKWEIAAQFRSKMDETLASDDQLLPAKLASVVLLTSQTIDNRYELSFHALADYARHEPNTVRSMLKELLLTDDNGDLSARMSRFVTFVNQCQSLLEKNMPDSWRYRPSIRLPMMLTGYYDPDQYYLFKAQQVKDYAECVEFYDELGSGTSFHLINYYRLCDALVDRIRQNERLIALNKTRYSLSNKPMHPDGNLHLLAFDVIYCSTVYHLFDGIHYTVKNAAERKQYTENKRVAEQLASEFATALTEAAELDRAMAFFTSQLTAGNRLLHKTKGYGLISSFDEKTGRLSLEFENGNTATLLWPACLLGGAISFESSIPAEEYAQMIRKIKLARGIRQNAKIAEQRLAPYEKFLK